MTRDRDAASAPAHPSSEPEAAGVPADRTATQPARAARRWGRLGSLPPLPLVLAAAAVVAALLAAHPGGGGVFATLALVLVAAACTAAGALWALRRHAERLHDVRMQHQLLLQLTDAWQWQTDADHRLVKLQPPLGAPASSWAAGASNASRLWDRFGDATASLQPRMQAHAALTETHVTQAGSGGVAQRWVLRGLPRFDAQGVFAGYQGLARPLPADADADGATAAAAPSDDALRAQALAAEHAAFSYTVSHDLRAPIRVVDGFARILKEDYGQVLDRIGNDHLDRVLGAAARMNHMIDALLSLSQLSAQPLQREPVNLSQLAAFVVDDLRRTQPGREVEVHIAPDLGALGDPTLLRLVLENLLGNAWKYSSKAAQPRIDFACSVQGGAPVFVIRDNGAGFDMRFADRLFGMFQRLHSAGDFPGTGVGLASVRRIVRRHGGEIWAESEVGRGARFYFTLSPGAAVPPAPRPGGTAQPG